MSDPFKKQDEDQPYGELFTEEPYKDCVEVSTVEEATRELCQSRKENVLAMLEALGGEEQELLTEKSQLLNMEETLRQKIIEEIEIKRNRIELLKQEIPELKQRCEVLAKALDIPVQK